MQTERTYKSDAFEAIHSSASALHTIGAIDNTEMHRFDESCHTESPDTGRAGHKDKLARD